MTAIQYDPAGCRMLVIALIGAAVEDAVAGDPTAWAWTQSDAFAHWCECVDVDPAWARQRIEHRAAATMPVLSDAAVMLAVRFHESGWAWEQAVATATGNRSEAVKRHAKQIASERFYYVADNRRTK